MYQSIDFKGYDLSNEREEIVPIGSLNHLSTKYEVFIYFVSKHLNVCANVIIKTFSSKI